jgi:hypothetical protein
MSGNVPRPATLVGFGAIEARNPTSVPSTSANAPGSTATAPPDATILPSMRQ